MPTTTHEPNHLLAAQLRALRLLHPGIEHALRGPVNGIVLNIELLKVQAVDPEIRDRLGVIGREINRLMYVVEPLLATLAVGHTEDSFDLRETVRSVHHLVAPHARQQHVALAFDQGPEEAFDIRGDGHAVRAALLVILANLLAERGMSNGSAAAVTVQLSRDDGNAELSLERTDPGGDGVGDGLDQESLEAARELLGTSRGELELRGPQHFRLRLAVQGPRS